MFLAAFAGIQAQDCNAIMLPFFNGDANRMANYPPEKLDIRCRYSQNAFYVSDTVPQGAVLRSLTEIKDYTTGNYLTENFVVNLNTLSYYGYSFQDMQCHYPKADVTICFPTPKSEHPYLVLRSLTETHMRTESPEYYAK